MRIVFMGTPDFAAGALEAIVAAGHDVVAVVTQPDKPKGRGKQMLMSPVKEAAKKHNLFVYQPVKIKAPEEVEKLRGFQADIFIVAAFGQILSKEILEMPKFGCVNIHASLLPKYRGAAPIQWAIIDGEEQTGITIMQMDIGIDTGDMLCKQAVPIAKKETGESLFEKLSIASAQLIVEALPKIERGELVPVKQKEEDSTYAKMLTKTLGHIDWHNSAVVIERLIRGLNSWPSAYTYYGGKTLKIWEADVMSEEKNGAEGTIAQVAKDWFSINTSDYQLKIQVLQLEGKKRMAVKDFLLGNTVTEGMQLDHES